MLGGAAGERPHPQRDTSGRVPPAGEAAASRCRERGARPYTRGWDHLVTPVPTEWYTTAPPNRTWLLRDTRRPSEPGVLPLGKVAGLIAAGGVGKTMTLLDLVRRGGDGDPVAADVLVPVARSRPGPPGRRGCGGGPPPLLSRRTGAPWTRALANSTRTSSHRLVNRPRPTLPREMWSCCPLPASHVRCLSGTPVGTRARRRSSTGSASTSSARGRGASSRSIPCHGSAGLMSRRTTLKAHASSRPWSPWRPSRGRRCSSLITPRRPPRARADAGGAGPQASSTGAGGRPRLSRRRPRSMTRTHATGWVELVVFELH